jgi:hypothetical protein
MNSARRLICILLALAFLKPFATSAVAQAAPNGAPSVPRIDFQDVMLEAAIWNLARTADLNFMIDPKVFNQPDERGVHRPQPKVTRRLENVTALEALDIVLRENGLSSSLNPATGVVRITGTNSASIATPVDAAWIKAGTNSAVPLVVFQETPLAATLRGLAKTDGLRVEIEEAVERPRPSPGRPFTDSPMVSLRWERITPRQAIAALCENYDLAIATNQSSGAIQIARRVTSESKPVAK